MAGHPQTPETRLKISLARKGKIPNGRLGTKHSEETKRKIASAPALNGAGRYNWQGDDVGYAGLHNWIRRKLGTPKICNYCSEVHNRCHWHNLSKEYKRDLTDWVRLCPKCHAKAEMEYGTLYGPKKST